MNTKSLIAGVAGGVALFAMGAIFYVALMPDFFASTMTQDPPGFVTIVIGELVFGFLLVWIFNQSGIASMVGGAKAGALYGFVIALGMGLILEGSTTMGSLTVYLADAVVWAIRWGVAGAVIGRLLVTKEEAVPA